MNYSVRELQNKLLALMKIIHRVCEENGISYYMLGGTMLGASRHKGFIPWDDDMDIGLPREDYDRLLSLSEKVWPSNIFIKRPSGSNNIVFPYVKIIDRSTTIIEDKLDGIVEGIYIDVFPLDGVGNNVIESKFNYYINFWLQVLLYNSQVSEIKSSFLREFVRLYAHRKSTSEWLSVLELWMRRKSYYDCKYVGNYSGSWGFSEIVHKDAMGSPMLYSFEDTELFGVANSHEYLTSLYGDYNKLPPLSKRKSHHKFIYIDLNNSFEDYKKSEAL